ncbi:MAG: Ty1/Copia family ribonuclease HI, partial [Pontimonas sp.]
GLMASTNLALLQHYKTKLREIYKITDLGPIDGHTHLGMEVTHRRDDSIVHISADAKVTTMLRRHGLTGVRKSEVPATPDSYHYEKAKLETSPPYDLRSFLGSCAFLADSCRPDITTITSVLASSVDWNAVRPADYDAGIRLAGYLRHAAPKSGLRYDGSGFRTVEEALLPRLLVDSDFNRSGDCKSRSGYVVFLANAPVIWASKRQSIVATSSTEAEVVAISEACKSVVWLRSFLTELGFNLPPSPVFIDNKSAKMLAADLVSSSKSRHIAPRFFWTRQLKDLGILDFKDVDTLDNVADVFTKLCKVTTQTRFIKRLIASP